LNIALSPRTLIFLVNQGQAICHKQNADHGSPGDRKGDIYSIMLRHLKDIYGRQISERPLTEIKGEYMFAGGRGAEDRSKPIVKLNNAHIGALKRSGVRGLPLTLECRGSPAFGKSFVRDMKLVVLFPHDTDVLQRVLGDIMFSDDLVILVPSQFVQLNLFPALVETFGCPSQKFHRVKVRIVVEERLVAHAFIPCLEHLMGSFKFRLGQFKAHHHVRAFAALIHELFVKLGWDRPDDWHHPAHAVCDQIESFMLWQWIRYLPLKSLNRMKIST
jgi:hypothetical protein